MARQLIGILGYVALFAVFLFVPAHLARLEHRTDCGDRADDVARQGERRLRGFHRSFDGGLRSARLPEAVSASSVKSAELQFNCWGFVEGYAP